MKELTCEERDKILNAEGHYKGWKPVSSFTDLVGAYGVPRIETVWEKDGRQIRDSRYLANGNDPEACFHYEIMAGGNDD